MPRPWSILARVEVIWISPKEGRRTSPGSRPSLEKQRNETDKPEVTVTPEATTTQRQDEGSRKRTRVGD